MTLAWNKADLHIHTTYSDDATASVEEILEYVATRTDLRVIAITDHDEIEGALKAQRLAKDYGIEVIVGEEVSTNEGHLLALFIEHFLAPGRPATETIAAVHEQGGICVAAHPYGWMVPSLGWHGLAERCAGDNKEWSLDGLEGFNASLWLPSNNVNATTTCQSLNLALCGGSDSHQLSTLGLGYTWFRGSTADDLRQSIQSRQTSAGGISWGYSRTLEYVGLKFRMMIREIAERSLKPSTP